MTGRLALGFVVVTFASAFAAVVVAPDHMLAPGALMDVHSALATDCFACHAPLGGLPASRCVGCHALGDLGVRTTAGVVLPQGAAFHQDLIEQGCVACHSDHAGVLRTEGERKPFSHELLRPEVRETCVACHTAPTDTLHDGFGDESCGVCHTLVGWKPATFEHARFFVLDGDHDASCETCHVGGDLTTYTCYGCHEHTRANVSAAHRREGIRDFADCVECHRSAEEGGEGEEEEDDD